MNGEPLSAVVAAKALDGLTMRMAALAHNIANAGSPTFQAVGVRFEDALGKAARRGPEAVRSLEFGFEAGRTYMIGEDRRLDLLIADASQTAARYAAVVDMMGRRMAIQRTVSGAQ
jgi:flagellar basal-body rod protein FlgB